MEINDEIFKILKEFKIDKHQGTLALLAIYFGLDAESTCSEEVIKAINLTKIIEKDYKAGKVRTVINWNVPLFKGQETAFQWVVDWAEAFTKKNPARVASDVDLKVNMKEFFAKYPQYRVDDVYKARDNYFASVNDFQFLLNPLSFIFDGKGGARKSTLLAWCQQLDRPASKGRQVGQVIR